MCSVSNMNRILHIVTRPEDPLPSMVMANQSESNQEVVEINLYEVGPDADYRVVLEEIFKADSIQVW